MTKQKPAIISYSAETQKRLSEIQRNVAKLPDSVKGASELKKRIALIKHHFAMFKGDLERLIEREKVDDKESCRSDPLDCD